MIDDFAKTMKLLEKIKTQLPIPAYAGKPFIQVMRERGIKIKPRQNLQIIDVLYLGDDGGIACAIKGTGQEEIAIVISITHIRIKDSHPLAIEIRAYQIERSKKLARMNSTIPTSYIIKPKREV